LQRLLPPVFENQGDSLPKIIEAFATRPALAVCARNLSAIGDMPRAVLLDHCREFVAHVDILPPPKPIAPIAADVGSGHLNSVSLTPVFVAEHFEKRPPAGANSRHPTSLYKFEPSPRIRASWRKISGSSLASASGSSCSST
jgi:hypothetical protein